MAWSLVALPALTAVVLLLLARFGALAAALAIASSTTSLALAGVSAFHMSTGSRAPFAEEAAVGPGHVMGGLDLPLGLSLSATSTFLVLVVALVVAAVQAYAAWYLAEDSRRGVFHATISLFGAAMVLVVLSADLVLTVVGWEVMGWCSYLLIGHWSHRPGPRRAAHSSFIVTRISDIGFLLGAAVLVAGAGSTDRARVLEHWSGGGGDLHHVALAAALVLLVVGVLGKAAQLPFHNWLLDAMEGPTPASALIHAATMVAAGTVVLAQLLPLLQREDGVVARTVLGGVVAATMVLAAVCALLEPDLKRLLAWSTISQIGVMLAPLAVVGDGAAGSALGHLYGHAIFKALLFLVVGWLALTRGSTRIAALSGSARQHPVALGAWAAGLASLAGVPMVLGGMTKEEVVASAAHGAETGSTLAQVVLVALVATAVLSAAYATRALLIATTGDEGRDGRRAVMPSAVAVVLVVLGVLSLLGGLGLGRLPEAAHVPLPLFGLMILAVLAGIGLGWLLHTRLGLDRLLEGRVGAGVGAGLGVDTVYRVTVVRPVLALARLVAYADRDLLDSYVGALTRAALGSSAAGERAHRRARPTIGLTLVGVGLVAAVALTGLVTGVLA